MRVINYHVPNPGGRLYPASVCLQMVLTLKGENYQIYQLENISGHPYGWFYLNDLINGDGMEIEISPGTELTNSLKVAANSIGYKCVHCLTDEWNEMKTFIQEEINKGNVLIFGPLSFKKLSYQIGAHRATRIASHYIVIVGYDEEKVFFHDPNGMSYATFMYKELKDSCTKEVILPGAEQYSAISIQEKVNEVSDKDLMKKVLVSAVSGYKEKKIRKNAYIGLNCIKRYSEDILVWLGAKTPYEKETVMRKIGLFFYPKGNQMRADAITYMQDIKRMMPEAGQEIDEFCELFKEACLIYKEGASIITPHMVQFDEVQLEKELANLHDSALDLFDIETQAHERLIRIQKMSK